MADIVNSTVANSRDFVTWRSKSRIDSCLGYWVEALCQKNENQTRPATVFIRLKIVQSGTCDSMYMTDEELVERANGGATDAFNQLVVRWERPIHALAYRVLGREEDASDVY